MPDYLAEYDRRQFGGTRKEGLYRLCEHSNRSKWGSECESQITAIASKALDDDVEFEKYCCFEGSEDDERRKTWRCNCTGVGKFPIGRFVKDGVVSRRCGAMSKKKVVGPCAKFTREWCNSDKNFGEQTEAGKRCRSLCLGSWWSNDRIADCKSIGGEARIHKYCGVIDNASGVPTIDPSAPGIVHKDPACECITKKPETDAERVAAGQKPSAAAPDGRGVIPQPNHCWYNKCRNPKNPLDFADDQFHSDAAQMVGCIGYWDCSLNIKGDVTLNLTDSASVAIQNSCGGVPYAPNGTPCRGLDPNAEYTIKNTAERRDCVFAGCKRGFRIGVGDATRCETIPSDGSNGSSEHDPLSLASPFTSSDDTTAEKSAPPPPDPTVMNHGATQMLSQNGLGIVQGGSLGGPIDPKVGNQEAISEVKPDVLFKDAETKTTNRQAIEFGSALKVSVAIMALVVLLLMIWLMW